MLAAPLRSMIVHNDLRASVGATDDFDAAPYDDASTMSCDSLSSSSSTSPQDSVVLTPYDPPFGPDFTGTTSFVDVEDLPPMGDNDFDIFFSDDKTVPPGNPQLASLHRSEFQSIEMQLNIELNHNFRPSAQDTAFDSGFSLPIRQPAFAPAGTITPSIAFGDQQPIHELGLLTPMSESLNSHIPEEYQVHATESSGNFWSTEPLLCQSLSPSRTPSRDSTCSPGVARNLAGRVRSYRPPQRTRNVKMGKGGTMVGHVELIPKQQIPCPFANCDKKFQRPEHLTRHKKSLAHCADCPWECPVETCKKAKGEKLKFNRQDNYHTHVVNCHLLDSDKARRQRIKDPILIEEYGWAKLRPQKEREEQKRQKKKQHEVRASKPCSRIQGNERVVKRSSARQNARHFPR